MASILKSIFGLILLSGPLYAGGYQMDYWILAPLALIFTIAKITEKPHTLTIYAKSLVGKDAAITPGQALLLIGSTLVGQIIVVGIFYTIFYGISSMISGSGDGSVTTQHWAIPLGLSSLGIIAAIIIARKGDDDFRPRLDRWLDMGNRSTIVPEEMLEQAHKIINRFDRTLQKNSLELIEEWRGLGSEEYISALELFLLARKLVKCSDEDGVGALMEEGFFVYNQPDQKRVFFSYIKFSCEDNRNIGMGKPETYIADAINECHQTCDYWYCYDAVQAYGAMDQRYDVIDSALIAISKKHGRDKINEEANYYDTQSSADLATLFINKIYEVIDSKGIDV